MTIVVIPPICGRVEDLTSDDVTVVEECVEGEECVEVEECVGLWGAMVDMDGVSPDAGWDVCAQSVTLVASPMQDGREIGSGVLLDVGTTRKPCGV